ncbi:MAG: nuclear transport factor 2 family protein [Acidobacteriota bacterium]
MLHDFLPADPLRLRQALPSRRRFLRAALLVACVFPGLPVWADSSPDPEEALRARDGAFHLAATSRDRATVESMLAEDAVFFADGLLRGRQAFLDGWAPQWTGKYGFAYEAATLEASVAEAGDLGFTLGTVTTRFQHPAEPEPSVTEGHYLHVWSRTEKGEWRLRASSALVVHPELGAAREPRSGLMTAWPELADQIGARIEIDWRPERTERAASGDLAFTVGSYGAAFGEAADRQSGEGHFLAVWRRDDEGAWQLAAEGFTPPALSN